MANRPGGKHPAACQWAQSRRPSAWRRELFDRLLIINEHHLRRVLTEYLAHYNTARPHRTLGQMPPAQAHARPRQIDLAEHRVRRQQVLGGLTHEYQIAA